MIYLDSNILIYAFSQNVDTEQQQIKAVDIFEQLLTENKLYISDISLFEFAFVSKKINEQSENIKDNLNFLKNYIELSKPIILNRTIEIMNELKMYNNSFDCFHIAFAEHYCNKIITYDKGFRKFKKITDLNIEILKT